jgi:hypothetical protein
MGCDDKGNLNDFESEKLTHPLPQVVLTVSKRKPEFGKFRRFIRVEHCSTLQPKTAQRSQRSTSTTQKR